MIYYFTRFFSQLFSFTFVTLFSKIFIFVLLPIFISFPHNVTAFLQYNGLYHVILGVSMSYPQIIILFTLSFLISKLGHWHKVLLGFQIIFIIIHVLSAFFYSYMSVPFNFHQLQNLVLDAFQLRQNLGVTLILKELFIVILLSCFFLVSLFLLIQFYIHRLLQYLALSWRKIAFLNIFFLFSLLIPTLFNLSLKLLQSQYNLEHFERIREIHQRNHNNFRAFLYAVAYSFVNPQRIVQINQNDATLYLLYSYLNQIQQFQRAQEKWLNPFLVQQFRSHLYDNQPFSYPNPQLPLLRKSKTFPLHSKALLSKPQNYNVVLFFLESSSRYFFQKRMNHKIVGHHLAQLTQNGLDFKFLYSSGLRSLEGMEALFYSSFPPIMNFHTQKIKHNNISVLDILIKRGYNIQFFDNYSTYFLLSQQYDLKSFQSSEDEFLLQKMFSAMQDIQNKPQKKPFFFVYINKDPHWPYGNIALDPKYPINLIFSKPSSFRHNFINIYDYSLKLITQFIQKTKQLSLFKKTLFIITADHKPQYMNFFQKDIAQSFSQECLLFIVYNPFIVKKILKIENRSASQLDIAPTILSILGIPESPSMFMGQNLLADSFYSNRFVFLPKTQQAIYQNYAISNGKAYQFNSLRNQFKLISFPSLIKRFKDTKDNISLYQNYYKYFINAMSKEQFYSSASISFIQKSFIQKHQKHQKHSQP